MSGVRMRARADLRRRWVSVVSLTLLAGLFGAVSMSAFSAARRSDTAYARFRQTTNEPELITASCDNGFFPHLDFEEVSKIPGAELVPYWITVPAVGAVLTDGKTPLSTYGPLESSLFAPLTERNDAVLRVIEGRLPTAVDEIAIARAPGIWQAGVGDDVILRFFRKDVVPADVYGAKEIPDGLFLPEMRMKVVGIYQSPNDLAGTDTTIFGTTALYEQLHETAAGCDAKVVQLAAGLAGIPAFERALTASTPGAFFFDMGQEAVYAERGTHLRSIVMTVFAWLALIAGFLVVGQAIVRRTLLGATDDPILRALGMSKRQVAAVPLVSALIIGVGGALIAVAVSVAASPFTETGLARFMEPEPGVWVDAPVLLIGAVAIVVSALLLTMIPAWRLAGAQAGVGGSAEYRGSARPSRVAAAASKVGLSPAGIAGTRLALEPGHGRSATPVRSAIAALALTIMAMVAAFGFAASMNHFIATPKLWGVDFEFGSGNPFTGEAFQTNGVPLLRDDPGLVNQTTGNFQTLGYVTSPRTTLATNVWALSGLDGAPVTPTMLQGRWPQTTDEIALGSSTLRELGLRVGDRVGVTAAGTTTEMTIVGIPVFPDFGFGPGFGDGAGMTFEGLQALDPTVTQNLVVANYAPGVPHAEVLDRVNPTLQKLQAQVVDDAAVELGDTNRDAQRSRNVPLVLASLFSIVAFATLVHVLVTSVRRRRRDLAILRTIGFTRRQISRTVAWQAATIAAAALAIGIPLGVVVGRFAWSLFAGRLGVVPVSVVDWTRVLLVVPVTIAIAIAISIGPALMARRTKPAIALRAE